MAASRFWNIVEGRVRNKDEANKTPRQVGTSVRFAKVLKHYESQTEEQAIAEDEAAFELKDQTVMVVPKKLVPEITS